MPIQRIVERELTLQEFLEGHALTLILTGPITVNYHLVFTVHIDGHLVEVRTRDGLRYVQLHGLGMTETDAMAHWIQQIKHRRLKHIDFDRFIWVGELSGNGLPELLKSADADEVPADRDAVRRRLVSAGATGAINDQTSTDSDVSDDVPF